MNVGAPTLEGSSIPGDPPGLQSIAARMRAARDEVADVQARVESGGVHEWSGSAAERFHMAIERIPPQLGRASGAFDAAAAALSRFAAEVADLQAGAARYAAQLSELGSALARAQQQHDAAQGEVDAARAAQAAATDPVAHKAAGEALEQRLSSWRAALAAVEEHEAEIAHVRQMAQANRQRYDAAVSACRAQLEEAQATLGGVRLTG